jgi:hypothetical protein
MVATNDYAATSENGPKSLTTAIQPFVDQTTGEVSIGRQLPVITADTIVLDMTPHMLLKIAQHRRATVHSQCSQALVELLKLAMEPLAFGSPANDKITSMTAMHIMREAEEVERLWTT